MATLIQLSEDCRYTIYRYLNIADLTVLKLTCKTLNENVAIYVNNYMEVLDLNGIHWRKLTKTFMRNLVESMPNVRGLRFPDVDFCIDFRIEQSRLKVLDLGCNKVSPNVLYNLAKNNHYLEAVILSKEAANLDDSFIKTLAENNIHLKNFDATIRVDYSLDSWYAVPKYGGRLFPTNSSILSLSKKCKNLTAFKIENNDSITDLSCLFENCTLLSVLSINSCGSVSSDSFSAISKFSKQLRVLHFWDCRCVTDSAIFAVVTQCQNLQDFKPNSQISDNSLIALSLNARNLTKVILLYASLVTDESIRTLAKYSKKLRLVRLGDNEQITDTAIQTLVECLPNLENFNPNWKITDDTLITLSIKAKNLTNLDVSSSKLTDRSIFALVTYSKHLKVLCFRSSDITENAIKAVIEGCPKLEVFSPNRNLTDTSLHKLGTFAKNLTKLRVVYCQQITDNGLISVAKNCGKLMLLHIMFCRNISRNGVFRLQEMIKVVKHVDERPGVRACLADFSYTD